MIKYLTTALLYTPLAYLTSIANVIAFFYIEGWQKWIALVYAIMFFAITIAGGVLALRLAVKIDELNDEHHKAIISNCNDLSIHNRFLNLITKEAMKKMSEKANQN